MGSSHGERFGLVYLLCARTTSDKFWWEESSATCLNAEPCHRFPLLQPRLAAEIRALLEQNLGPHALEIMRRISIR